MDLLHRGRGLLRINGRQDKDGARMTRWIVFFMILSVFVIPASAAEQADAGGRELHVRTWERLIQIRAEAAEDVRRRDLEIERCDQVVAKADEIIRRARAQGETKAEQLGLQARSAALEAKKKNHAARAAAILTVQRADRALVSTRTLLLKDAHEPQPKVDCVALLRQRQNDPVKSAEQDCVCIDNERPPLCVRKGGKMPERGDGNYWFQYAMEVQTLTGGQKLIEDYYMGTHKTLDEAKRACLQSARAKALGRGEQPLGEPECALVWGSVNRTP